MPDILASIGIHQLLKAETFLEKRRAIARRYDESFGNLPGVQLQPKPSNDQDRHALHLYVLCLDLDQFRVDRNHILAALRAENIGAALHYRAVHTHPYYRETYGYQADDFPHAAKIGDSIFSLPLTPCMTDEDVSDVIKAVDKVLNTYYA